MRILPVTLSAVVVFAALSALIHGRQLPVEPSATARPGYPTLAQVQVLNKLPADAVSVRVFNPDPLPTTVVGVPTVALVPGSAVDTRVVRQRWEYRQIVTANGVDPTAELNTAGAEGWEVAGASPFDARQTAWLLKRVR
jgi:hypothetical protein